MGDRSSGQRRGAGGVGGMGVGMGDIAGLFPSDSDEDEGQAYGSRSHVSTAKKAPESANKGDDAQGNWGLFPGKEGPLAQPPAPGAAGLAASLTPASEQVSGGTGKLKVKKGKKKKTKATAAVKDEGKAISSPLHTGVDDKVQDIEAACSTQPPPTSKSAEEEASDEFEVGENNEPKDRMPCRPFRRSRIIHTYVLTCFSSPLLLYSIVSTYQPGGVRALRSSVVPAAIV